MDGVTVKKEPAEAGAMPPGRLAQCDRRGAAPGDGSSGRSAGFGRGRPVFGQLLGAGVPATTGVAGGSSWSAGACGNAAYPAAVHVPKYDGKADWASFRAQFEMLAAAAGWTMEVKALQLALCLTGDALSVLGLLDDAEKGDYAVLVAALGRRFGGEVAACALRAELSGRRRRPGESLKDLASDVERLTYRAHAGLPAGVRDYLACNRFLEALVPDELRVYATLAHPETLGDALQLASEREALLQAMTTGGPHVRAAQKTEPGVQPEKRSDGLEALTALVTSMAERLERLELQRSPARGPGGDGRGACFGCGRTGHFRRDCPERVRDAPGNDGGPR